MAEPESFEERIEKMLRDMTPEEIEELLRTLPDQDHLKEEPESEPTPNEKKKTLEVKSGGSVKKKYAYGGRVAKSSMEKS
tara:strand:+ start:71 stop:310 length:240 start_codon:yes stop_codon:yes gene_type:complete